MILENPASSSFRSAGIGLNLVGSEVLEQVIHVPFVVTLAGSQIRRDATHCPHDCPCAAPKQRLGSQQQPSRPIGEAKQTEGFAKKIEDVREADFRLANRRLQPLGHLTVDAKFT